MKYSSYNIGATNSKTTNIERLEEKLYTLALGRFRVSTVEVAVLNTNDEILLCKRQQQPGKGDWWIIGTKLIGGESLKKAAKRVLETEINIEIEDDRIQFLDLIKFINWAPNEERPYGEYNQHNIGYIKIDKLEQKKISLNSIEHSDYKFVKLKEITNCNYINPLKEITEILGRLRIS